LYDIFKYKTVKGFVEALRNFRNDKKLIGCRGCYRHFTRYIRGRDSLLKFFPGDSWWNKLNAWKAWYVWDLVYTKTKVKLLLGLEILLIKSIQTSCLEYYESFDLWLKVWHKH
jgi:hypothetical protein